MPNPSFGFGINKKYKIQVGLEYSDIDFDGKDMFGEGFYQLQLRSTGSRERKVVVNVKRR